MRKHGRTDANQTEVIKALRQAGANVVSLANCGAGIPDLLIGFRQKTYLLEVKDGSKPPSQRELTPDQRVFHAGWYGGPLMVVNSVDEALTAIGVL